MKKVLIITYYWPPSGGGGVQRWLKMSKYLPQFGWKPFVVVPKNPEYPTIDETLLKDISEEVEVIELPIWEPYGIFKKITGRKKTDKVNSGLLFDEKKQSFSEKISLWIRGNILIPDPRIFWVYPSANRLKKMIPELDPQVIVTTGPPHSVHLIGLKLKKKFPHIKWIADFRDPWSEIDYLDSFYSSKIARNWQKKLEKKVLDSSDNVLTVSPTWRKELQNMTRTKVNCITNGYDIDDFIQQKIVPEENKFIISHIGFINSYRNPVALWEAIEELCVDNEEFQKKLLIQIIGTSDRGLQTSIENYPNVSKNTIITGYIPHTEVIKKYSQSACLLLLLNNSKNSKGHIPGKFFEYLAAKQPILAIGPLNSDINEIIIKCKAGVTCEFNDKEEIKHTLLKFYNLQKTSAKSKGNSITEYSRSALTKDLVNMM